MHAIFSPHGGLDLRTGRGVQRGACVQEQAKKDKETKAKLDKELKAKQKKEKSAKAKLDKEKAAKEKVPPPNNIPVIAPTMYAVCS